MNARIYAVLTAALALLAPGAARADTTYKLQPIIKSGDRVGDFAFGPAKNQFIVVGLNDAGQLLFLGQNDAARSGILVQYANGTFTPIAAPGKDRPGGQWPSNIGFWRPMTMNQRGNVAFNPGTGEPPRSLGVFSWDAQTRQVTPVALAGMPTVNSLTFAEGGGSGIANRSVLFAAQRTNGGPWGLYRWNDGQLIPVLVRGQALPGGGTLRELQDVFANTVNDAGQHAFPLTLTEGGATRRGAYLLGPDGKLSLILKEGMVTELGTITHLGTPVGTGGSAGGIGLNSQGQVALPVRIDNGPPTLVLLTPAAP